jgi:CDGSH-type Zn-finger protein
MSSDDVVIVPYKDGPYLVRGAVVIRDQEGAGIESGRRIVALCRCGKSRIRPFCDGTHRLAGFKASSGPERNVIQSGPPPSQNSNGAGNHDRPAPNPIVPVVPKHASLQDELRGIQRRLTRLLQGQQPKGSSHPELVTITAQLSAVLTMLESETDGC